MERVTTLTFRFINNLADFLLVLFSFFLGAIAWSYTYRGVFRLTDLSSLPYSRAAICFLLFYAALFVYLAGVGAYRASRLRTLHASAVVYLRAVCLAVVVCVVLAYFMPFFAISRSLILTAGVMSFALLLAKEIALYSLLRYLRGRGRYVRRTIIVGSDTETLSSVLTQAQREVFLGLHPVGVIYSHRDSMPPDFAKDSPLPVLGGIKDFIEIIERYCPDGVMFFAREMEATVLEEALWVCEERGIEVWLKLELLDRIVFQANLYSIGGMPFINFSGQPQNVAALWLKYISDRLVGAALLFILSPLLLLVALAIKLTSPGPVFFCQERAGLNGKKFVMYKFRSMVADAERQQRELQRSNDLDGPAFKMKNDPRITRLGRALRKTSIDELPQLWNVLKGEMSLVGPRPMDVKEVEKIVGWQRRRLSMKPGITCLWQVYGRSNIKGFDDWMKLDLEYIDNWSFGLDIEILLRTVPVVVFCRGAV